MTSYSSTHRHFNLCLVSGDAVDVTSGTYGYTSTWVVPWAQIMPRDIPPNTNWLVKHRFIEGSPFGGPRDLRWTLTRRGFSMFSNLVTNSGLASGTTSSNNTSLQPTRNTAYLTMGFLNTA